MQGDSFFNLPTLGQYLKWAENQGCHVELGEKYGVFMVKITAPDQSRSVVEFGMQLEEGMVQHKFGIMTAISR